MPTNHHRQIPIRKKILGLYYNDFQTDAPCTDSQIPALAIENSFFSSPVEKVGLILSGNAEDAHQTMHRGAGHLDGAIFGMKSPVQTQGAMPMAQLRPLDPAIPIDRQLTVAASQSSGMKDRLSISDRGDQLATMTHAPKRRRIECGHW
jgi:hypothetical protein